MKKRKKMKFRVDEDLLYAKPVHTASPLTPLTPYKPATIHAETLVDEDIRLAMDNCLPSALRSMIEYDQEGSKFLGYPFLQVLSQNPLIAAGVETIADEMTKKFVKLVHTGDDSAKKECGMKSEFAVEDKLKILEAELKKFKISSLFRRCAEKTGYYGGCLAYIDSGGIDDPELLKSPLYFDRTIIKKGSLKHFTIIDPVNVSPGFYNTSDPLRNDYFKPQTWFVMGKEVHASRFLYFAGKEAPLLLKPAYNFFGVSQAQLAFEYVENFQKNRDSGSELLNKFSVSIFKTNMQNAMYAGETAELEKRIQYFVHKRHNDGVFVLDKDDEDFIKSDTSLGGVTDIIRQSLELIASVFRLPAVKYLGISPSGFNATGESDLTNFYSLIESLQEKQFADNLEKVLKLLQLNKFGEIDPHIGFEFIPLDEEDDKIKAEKEKMQADTLAVYLDRNVISAEEARKIGASDKEGILKGIDPDSTEFMDDFENEESNGEKPFLSDF
ncbi:MAG: DUF1073 domain-containing protein [Mailhella sp.]|nr:DUF1073 domain-containing protein [Mailhella sp.]